MKRKFVWLVAWVCFQIYGGSVSVYAEDQVITDIMGRHTVKISIRDLNRLVCDGGVRHFMYSKEKEIQLQIEGKDLWVKILPVEHVIPSTGDTRLEYKNDPRDIYVVCGPDDDLYTVSLTVAPVEMPAATIMISPKDRPNKKARRYEMSGDYVDMLLQLVAKGYKTELMEYGYNEVEVKPQIRKYQEASILPMKQYDGDIYSVYEFSLTAQEEKVFSEVQFVDLVHNPLAISIIDPRLGVGESTRVIIIGKRVGDKGHAN